MTKTSASWKVYFLSLVDPADSDRDIGLVKVGITKNDVERRIEQLQTGNPYQILCEASFSSSVARQVENWVHRTNASRVVQLEWLRLPRSEIPSLVTAAANEGERFARIAEATSRWSRVKSNGVERAPDDKDRQIHGAARDVLAKLCPLRLQLERAEIGIALQTGNVRRIPGIVRISASPPTKRFSSKIALETFPTLALDHMVNKTGGVFRWRGVPNAGAREWAELREEVERLKERRQELNSAMLGDDSWLRVEGKRTAELARLHDDYLALKQQEKRLSVDEEEIKAEASRALEDCEAIAGVCSFRREQKQVLNRNSFQAAHPVEAAQCIFECNATVRRRIYYSRSY